MSHRSPLGSNYHACAFSDCSSEHAVWSGGPSDVVYLGLGPGLPAASSSDSTSSLDLRLGEVEQLPALLR